MNLGALFSLLLVRDSTRLAKPFVWETSAVTGVIRAEDWRRQGGICPLVMEYEGRGCVAGGASSFSESVLVSDMTSVFVLTPLRDVREGRDWIGGVRSSFCASLLLVREMTSLNSLSRPCYAVW